MSGTSMADRRILIAEDEYMLANEIASALDGQGATVLGPVSRVGEALDLVATEARIDAAVLDINLNGEMVWPVVDALLVRGVPVLLATGYDVEVIPARYVPLSCCEKPTNGREITRALGQAIAAVR